MSASRVSVTSNYQPLDYQHQIPTPNNHCQSPTGLSSLTANQHDLQVTDIRIRRACTDQVSQTIEKFVRVVVVEVLLRSWQSHRLCTRDRGGIDQPARRIGRPVNSISADTGGDDGQTDGAKR